MELKVGKFKPEYVSKMDIYLEGLDRQAKNPEENPSVGLLLCASKNDEVVEYAMSRTLSPTMVAVYQLQLPDKEVLRKKLQELSSLPEIEGNTGGDEDTFHMTFSSWHSIIMVCRDGQTSPRLPL